MCRGFSALKTEESVKRPKTNDLLLLIECAVYFSCLAVFLIIGAAGAVTAQAANVIYCVFMILSFGYMFVSDFLFGKYDHAVHGKMLAKNYIPAQNGAGVRKRRGTAAVIVLWVVFLLFLALLKHFGLLSWYVFLAGACIVFIMNSIFVRKKCLLSVMFLHNRNDCCKSCGINGWDHAIFASALVFAPRLSAAAEIIDLVLIVLSFVLMIIWEVNYHRHPERFYPETNQALRCAYCKKQCRYGSKG